MGHWLGLCVISHLLLYLSSLVITFHYCKHPLEFLYQFYSIFDDNFVDSSQVKHIYLCQLEDKDLFHASSRKVILGSFHGHLFSR